MRSTAHLLRDDDQGVLVLGQEVEDAPDLEGVVMGDDEPARVQVLPGAQRPAHLVEVLAIKVIGHLPEPEAEPEPAGFYRLLTSVRTLLRKTAWKTLEFHS